ncbi:hypothetical protein ACFQFQ_24610 [Sulfitobacter porphyrae]|uniref:Endonuclease/exonuclease/phosphatase domain-containing protein n=1 Tax=Sulfitobacter porphyrae TaxID=1246864 RepID=A0ABW2B8D7_9RHOB|nr:hypothetical protein GCM10007928_37790 [Sulfitobacter porphyrae]
MIDNAGTGGLRIAATGKTPLAVLRHAGLTELVTSRGFEGTRNSQYKKPGRFADYLLINHAADVIRFDVIHEPEVSDHCPIILEI